MRDFLLSVARPGQVSALVQMQMFQEELASWKPLLSDIGYWPNPLAFAN